MPKPMPTSDAFAHGIGDSTDQVGRELLAWQSFCAA
jgi:hypothetical protein